MSADTPNVRNKSGAQLFGLLEHNAALAARKGPRSTHYAGIRDTVIRELARRQAPQTDIVKYARLTPGKVQNIIDKKEA